MKNDLYHDLDFEVCGHKAIKTSRRGGVLLAAAFTAVVTCSAHGQPTNVDVLGDLAIRCIGHVPDTISSFILESPERMPYLRPRLTAYWHDKGHRVFLSDSVSVGARTLELYRLTYAPEEALVSYEAIEDSRLKRTITLSIGHNMVAPSGLLVDDGRCRDEYADTINRSDILRLQADPFPETRGEIPPEGSWRDWAEPVVLGATVGVVVYLFFTIRSS